MDGYYHLFSSSEEEWAYYARYIQFMHDSPVGIPYKDLYKLLKDKDCKLSHPFRTDSTLSGAWPYANGNGYVYEKELRNLVDHVKIHYLGVFR